MAKVKHRIRTRDGEKDVSLTPLKAIREKCEECFCWEDVVKGIRNCASKLCPLYPFRFGRNPGLKGLTQGNPEAFKNVPAPERQSRKKV